MHSTESCLHSNDFQESDQPTSINPPSNLSLTPLTQVEVVPPELSTKLELTERTLDHNVERERQRGSLQAARSSAQLMSFPLPSIAFVGLKMALHMTTYPTRTSPLVDFLPFHLPSYVLYFFPFSISSVHIR